MTKAPRPPLILTVAGLLCLLGCSKQNQHSSNSAQSPNPNSPSAAVSPASFPDESQYIVYSIVSDIAEETFYAAKHKIPDPAYFSVSVVEDTNSPIESPTYAIEIKFDSDHPAVKAQLDISGPIWSPANYKDLTRTLAGQTGLKSPGTSTHEDTRLLTALLDARAETIQSENEKLSKALQSNFSDANLHEQAAVLLAAFALRDNSGKFFEISSPLCRLAAHLSIAYELNGGKPLGINGQIAEAALLTLMNNEAAALDKIAAIAYDDPAADRWCRALEAYASHDYRHLTRNASPLERIAWFHAFSYSVDVDIAWEKLTEKERATIDFVRIAHDRPFSVEIGHELLKSSVPLELTEAARIYESNFGQKPKLPELVQALNETPTGCFNERNAIRIISWGHWADFFQRQLCQAIKRDHSFIANAWGVPEEATDYAQKTQTAFGKLRLYPFVQNFFTGGFADSDSEACAVARRTPQLIPGPCWNSLGSGTLVMALQTPASTAPGNAATPPDPFAFRDQWLRHGHPPYTAYNPGTPYPWPDPREEPVVYYRKLHNIAPYDSDIAEDYCQKLEGNGSQPFTEEEVREAYGSVLPFATYAMLRLADVLERQPDKYEPLLASAAELDPSIYFTLGHYFISSNPDKAAEYYEKGDEKCPDSVMASQYAGWQVDYYLDKGQTNKAEQIADGAADTYSQAGLDAKVRFLNAIGKRIEAYEWQKKSVERYGGPMPTRPSSDGPLPTPPKPSTPPQSAQTVRRVAHPFGNQTPTNGVLITDIISDQKGLVRGVLRPGDVIISVNHKRVKDVESFNQAYAQFPHSAIIITAWQGNRFTDVTFKTNFPFSVTNYVAPPPNNTASDGQKH
jgi:hypothetical protein